MDLIDICERAKEAGIDVEIRIDTDTGHHQMEPFVVIEGCTHPVMGHGRDRYAVRYSVDMLKETKMAAEDLIKRAMDEIIANLCPEEKILTNEDWQKATEHLYLMIGIYSSYTWPGASSLSMGLNTLKRRLLSGERSVELYDAIMALD